MVRSVAQGSDPTAVESRIERRGYDDIKLVHASGRSQIYSATRVAGSEPVVLKLFQATSRGRQRAREEVDALRACTRRGIPRVFELDLAGERPCLALERVSGTSLRSRVESHGPLPIERVLEVARQWAELLSSVHAARWVHRGVMPSNLMLDVEAHSAGLIDFGSARPPGAVSGGADADLEGADAVERLQYMAPEQTGRMNRGYGFASDLYGLGGAIYFALTATRPSRWTIPSS